jgi:hypothetical protein
MILLWVIKEGVFTDSILSGGRFMRYKTVLAMFSSTVLFVSVPSPTTGQGTAKNDAGANEVEISFLNGSTVRMVIQTKSLEIATPYGKLTVPAKHLRAIEFGLHFPPGAEAKIEQALKNLGSSNYQEREKASAALLELGPFSYPAVLEASRDKDLETSKRAGELVKKLQGKHPKKDLKTSADDKVVTPTFTIIGRILAPTIKVKAEYFGEAELSLSNMRTLHSPGEQSRSLDVLVDAGKYASPGQWLETKAEVDGRTALLITAKGQVDYGPAQIQNPSTMCGPNGFQAQGGLKVRRVINGVIVGGVVVAPGQKVGVISENHVGMLLGKIGENGEPFFIGEHYEATPDAEGILYLHIGPSPNNGPSSGIYDVKITRKK